jgi:hypothetical protein
MTRFPLLLSLVVSLAMASDAAAQATAAKPDAPSSAKTATRELFDGKTLKNWKTTEFGGEGEVYVKDGTIVLEMGADMTGITWAGGGLPTMNYEISLEAMRVEGNDFFCGLTFPVEKSPCSLIVGGWGGGVVGLSSIDGFDASENDTTEFVSFESGKWYPIRLRVTPNRIEAWIGKDKLVDKDTTDHELSIRPEVDLSRPLGMATWCTKGALKNIKLQTLPATSQKKPGKE